MANEPYMHGIYVNVNDTQMPAPKFSSGGVQVVIGTAPVNLADNPGMAVNRPILCTTLDQAKNEIGYSENCDWSEYTLCQSIYASFIKYKVSPVVLINVLDPSVHRKSVDQTEFTVLKRKCTVQTFGIVPASVVVKTATDGTALEKGKDYVQSFDSDGYLTISLLAAGSAAGATKLFVSYDKLDPTAVDADDIIGGVSVDNESESGLALIRQIYPRLGVNAGLVVAPGWSHLPTVAAAMEAKCERINGCFTSDCVIDVDCSQTGARMRTDVQAKKEALGATSEHSILCWPMTKKGNHIIAMSADLAARVIKTDQANDDVPYQSPSNKELDVDMITLADGTEVMLDFEQANELNGIGVVTAINRRGYYSWGNNTAAYPGTTDPVKRWINIRRFFTWWSNNFVNSFLDRVDDLANMRLVECVVDEENIRCNGYVANGYCAGASVEYNPEKTDILNGKIVLKQKLTPYPPAETIINEVEYDVNELIAVMGGEQ